MRAYKKILFFVTPYLLPKAKANLFIIGGQKCGTSSLFRTLSTHKHINPSLFKEAHFFEKNYSLGSLWYDGLFFSSWFKRNVKFNMESSPNYVMYPKALKRIQGYNQNAKIIFITRDRVDRAYSQYRHNKRFRPHEVKYDFESSLINEEKILRANPFKKGSKKYCKYRDKFNYIERSSYSAQLETLYSVFNRENILILNFEKLFDESLCDSEFVKIGNFLNLNISDLKKKKAMINTTVKNELNDEKRNLFNEKYFLEDATICKNKFGLTI